MFHQCSITLLGVENLNQLEIMADKYMLIKDILEEIVFMKQLFIFIILIRISLIKIDMEFLLHLVS